MPSQIRSAGESAGRRFKRRRKRKRGKRGAVSARRGRDKAVEGKERQKRDRTERPGDRKDKLEKRKFQRSRKRRPKRRKRRQGGEKLKARRDFGRDRPEPEKREKGEKWEKRERVDRPSERRGPARQGLSDMKARINEIKARRERFSQRRPEQVAEDRGFDPSRLQDFRDGGRYQPQRDPIPAPPVIGQDGRVDSQPAEPMPAPAPVGDDRMYPAPPLGGDGVQYPAPQPGGDFGPGGPGFQNGSDIVPGQDGMGVGYTPPGAPGPTLEPGIPTDAYGQPAKGPPPTGPYNPGMPQPGPGGPGGGGYGDQGYLWSGRQRQRMNPRAAGMDRFAQPPVQQLPRPEDQPRY